MTLEIYMNLKTLWHRYQIHKEMKEKKLIMDL